MKKYFLIGIPNSGKSTLGRRAAEKLRIPFYDTDLIICEKLDNPLDLFRITFNGQFAAEQIKIISKLAKLNGKALIATGAEAALSPECASLMKDSGTVINIKRKPDILLEEYKKSGKRGMIMKEENGKEINMQEEAIRLYAKECSQYEALADLSFENDGTEDEALEKLLKLMENSGD
jgi:shikimate kinase